jgi:bacterial/archaeal transporter family protein
VSSTQVEIIPWQLWDFLSALFAALTPILEKVSVEDINPDLATFIRTIFSLLVLGCLVIISGQKPAK